MPNRRFDENPAATTLDGTEIFPLTQGGIDKKGTQAQVLRVAADKELRVGPRGATSYPGRIRFETVPTGSPAPPAPTWDLSVGNAFTQDFDHIFQQTFNLRWNDALKSWERELAGRTCVRFGFESSFRDYAPNPLAIKGTFEWNLDIDPNTTGVAFATQKRPWFLTYDYDNNYCHLQLGDPADRATNVFELYGGVTNMRQFAMKDAAAIEFFQISRDTPGAATSNVSIYSTNGPIWFNQVNNEEVRFGNPSTTGGLIWLYSVVEARNDINVLGKLKWNNGANTQTTVGAAGSAAALPVLPTKYLKVLDNAGTVLVIPAYTA